MSALLAVQQARDLGGGDAVRDGGFAQHEHDLRIERTLLAVREGDQGRMQTRRHAHQHGIGLSRHTVSLPRALSVCYDCIVISNEESQS